MQIIACNIPFQCAFSKKLCQFGQCPSVFNQHYNMGRKKDWGKCAAVCLSNMLKQQYIAKISSLIIITYYLHILLTYIYTYINSCHWSKSLQMVKEISSTDLSVVSTACASIKCLYMHSAHTGRETPCRQRQQINKQPVHGQM